MKVMRMLHVCALLWSSLIAAVSAAQCVQLLWQRLTFPNARDAIIQPLYLPMCVFLDTDELKQAG